MEQSQAIEQYHNSSSNVSNEDDWGSS